MKCIFILLVILSLLAVLCGADSIIPAALPEIDLRDPQPTLAPEPVPYDYMNDPPVTMPPAETVPAE